MPTLTLIAGGGGTTVPTPGTHEYTLNSVVEGITAQAYAGCMFTSWLLDGVPVSVNPISVFMDTDHELQANFAGAQPSPSTTHILTITIIGQGITRPPGNNVYEYDADTQVTVNALALNGDMFLNWILDGVEHLENPLTVLMDTDHTLTATFTEPGQPSPVTPGTELPWQLAVIVAGISTPILTVIFLRVLSGGIT